MELAPRRRKAKGHIRLSLRKVLQPLTVWHCSFQRFKAMHAKWIFRLQTSCWPSFRVNVIVSQFFSFQGVWRQEKTVPMCPFSYEIWAFLNCLSRRRQWHPTPVLLPGKISWMEEPGRLQSMGLLRVGYDWATSLSLFTFMHWRRKWQPTPVFLPGESQGRGSLVGCCLWGLTESDMTEAI